MVCINQDSAAEVGDTKLSSPCPLWRRQRASPSLYVQIAPRPPIQQIADSIPVEVSDRLLYTDRPPALPPSRESTRMALEGGGAFLFTRGIGGFTKSL
jgi:hypothetical protein